MLQKISGLLQVEQQDVVLFSDYEESGEMWIGTGPRVSVTVQRFERPFNSPPAVHCSLSMWDIDNSKNARVDIRAENITTDQFEIIVKTWADTKIARARAVWIAIGEAAFEDEWDLY